MKKRLLAPHCLILLFSSYIALLFLVKNKLKNKTKNYKKKKSSLTTPKLLNESSRNHPIPFRSSLIMPYGWHIASGSTTL
jgi:hypothetical protein